ncbi:MAG: AAA family ATPase [Patescibacteria group bacterium]|nr:AAA family ATPase [Patescibacteria group bacterium]
MLYKWPLIGHEKQVEKLESDLKNDNLAHAYIFVGPEKVGKFLVAKTLAHILQCNDNYCRVCPTCKQIAKGAHLDTTEMRDDGTSIKIEPVREIITSLNMSAQSNYKIVLLDNIGRMTPDAANCFLKTLEEPPKKTLFLMTAGNLRELLPTIISRCRVMKFPAISEKALKKKMQDMREALQIESTEDMLERAVMLSLGRPGKAIELLREPEAMMGYLKLYNDIRALFRDKDLTKRFMYVQDLTAKDSDPRDLEAFFEIFLHVVRSFVNADNTEEYPEIIRFSKEDFLNLINKIEETRYLMGRNVNAKLALENLMLSF